MAAVGVEDVSGSTMEFLGGDWTVLTSAGRSEAWDNCDVAIDPDDGPSTVTSISPRSVFRKKS